MRCSVRSERQVAILATGLLCYWWRRPSSRGPTEDSVLRIFCLFLGFQLLTSSFCWYLYEDHGCASAVPSVFGDSFTHIGDHWPLFLRGVRSPFLGSWKKEKVSILSLFCEKKSSGIGRGRTSTMCPAHIWNTWPLSYNRTVGCLLTDGDSSVSQSQCSAVQD